MWTQVRKREKWKNDPCRIMMISNHKGLPQLHGLKSLATHVGLGSLGVLWPICSNCMPLPLLHNKLPRTEKVCSYLGTLSTTCATFCYSMLDHILRKCHSMSSRKLSKLPTSVARPKRSEKTRRDVSFELQILESSHAKLALLNYV